MNDFISMEQIGKGAYGVVYKVHHNNGTTMAVKYVRVPSGGMETVLNEIELTTHLTNPNILQIYGYETKSGEVDGFVYDMVIYMEYIDGVDLELLAAQDEDVRLEHADMYMEQLIKALAYMHSKCVIHRDIKVTNIMISDDRAIFIDFGLGCKQCIHSSPRCGKCEVAIRCSKKSVVGSPLYFSPDKARASMNTSLEYEPAADDVWGLGISLLELYKGESHTICDNSNNIVECVKHIANLQQTELGISDSIPERPRKILEQMLIIDENKRPSAQQLVDMFY